MTRKFAFLLAMVLCGTGVVVFTPERVSAQTNLTRAVVQKFRNRVKLHKNRQIRPARVNDQLLPRDALSTETRSNAELRFNDGSLARIGERSLFRFTPKTREFRLDNGRLLLLIPPGRGRTKVRTENAAAGIRGSALFISYDPETDTTLIGALTNSQIEVYNKDATQTQPLAAGQLAVVVKDRIERLYEFDLRTFYETSTLVEGLDLSGKQSPSSDEAIAQVQAETIQALNAQQPVVGTRIPIDDLIAKNPRDISSNNFSQSVPISNGREVDPPNSLEGTLPSPDPDPGEKPVPPKPEPPQPVPGPPKEGPPKEGPGEGPPKEGGDVPENRNPVTPVGGGIGKVSTNPITNPGNKEEKPEIPGDDTAGKKPEGSEGRDQPSPGQGEGNHDRPNPNPPQGGETGSGENHDRPNQNPPQGGSGENHDRPNPNPPRSENNGVGEGDRKSPPRIEAERPERPRESNNVAQSGGNEAQPRVPEVARPVVPNVSVRTETAVRSPDVAAPSGSFSAATITGNTDPNPTAIAPIAVIETSPPPVVVSTPNNPASVPAPPVSQPAATVTTTPPANGVNQPTPASTSTTVATPVRDPALATGGTNNPASAAGGSPATGGGISTVDPTPAGTSGSTPSVVDPVGQGTPGNVGGASSPVTPTPDPLTITDPTGTPPGWKPGDPIDPIDPVAKTGTINPPVAPTPPIDPAPINSPPIDPVTPTPTVPTVIDPPTPTVDPTVNTPVIDPTVNTPVVDPTVNTPVIDPTVNTPVIDPTVNTPVVDPTVNTPVVDPTVNVPVIDPTVNTPAIDPSTLPTNNLPIDPNSSINPINNTAPTGVDPNLPKDPINPPVVDPNLTKTPIDPGAGLPGNANSGNPNGMGNPNPGNPNGNPNPGNPHGQSN